nr:MAG TPA: hypothetical protein [Caudoviricetes sp.]
MESGTGQTHFTRHAFFSLHPPGDRRVVLSRRSPHGITRWESSPQSRGTAGSAPADTTTIFWISFSSGAGTCHGVPAPTHAGRLLTSRVRRWLADTYLCGGPFPSLRSNASAPGRLRVKDSGHPLSPGGSDGRVVFWATRAAALTQNEKSGALSTGADIREGSRGCLSF